MGATRLKSTAPDDDEGIKENTDQLLPKSKGKAPRLEKKGKKRSNLQGLEESTVRKMPKRAAACKDFKEKPVHKSDQSDVIEAKDDQFVDEEDVAVRLTGQVEGRPCRKLLEYILHDSDGVPQPFEMVELSDVYITGLISPLEDNGGGKGQAKGVRCESFGRIEEWAISGYEDGSPIIWVSTVIADYECCKPSVTYKGHYEQFRTKASACIQVYKKLSKSSGGNPNLSFEEMLAGVVRAMNSDSTMKFFSSAAQIRDFIISHGEFIYKELVGLDDTSKKSEQSFVDLPALVALRDLASQQEHFPQVQSVFSGGSLRIGPKDNVDSTNNSSNCPTEDDDRRFARLVDEEERWRSMKSRKKSQPSSASGKYYIKINEDEIANDYPLPAYYSTTNDEADEYVVFDTGLDTYEYDIRDLPVRKLHNWALYNSDSRMIPLELLPMKPCAEIDVTIYGSGVVTEDDQSGYTDYIQSSSNGSLAPEVEGIPVYLSAIKEWKVEFGSELVFLSVRTDMSWYRLGEPSKQYEPWYRTVLKTARVAIRIITLLKNEPRVARLSFSDIIKKVSEFDKHDRAYISTKADVVERYIVVHGQIILQQFSEFPDENIKKSPFVVGLTQNMERRHHTKWLVKKKKMVEQRHGSNLNPRAAMAPIASKRKAMQATTTRLVNRIWGEYYSNYSPEESNECINSDKIEDVKEDEVEELDENEEDDAHVDPPQTSLEKTHTPTSSSRRTKSFSSKEEIKWVGISAGKTSKGESLYKLANVPTGEIGVGNVVLVENDESDEVCDMYFIEYMFEKLNGSKMFHGRMMVRGSETVLGNAANKREVFLTNECDDFKLDNVKQRVTMEIRNRPWGHQHRKEVAVADKTDRSKAEEREKKGLAMEYYCKSLYSPEKGAFFSLPTTKLGLGSGVCCSCKLRESDAKKENFEINASKTSFVYLGIEYSIHDYVYVNPHQFDARRVESETYKGGRNVGLKAYGVCQLLEIVTHSTRKVEPSHAQVKVRRFFRPEDISADKAYFSDIREIYFSEEVHGVAIDSIEGKCEVRRKRDLPSEDVPAIFDHVFFCEHLYDPSKGSLKQMPSNIKLRYSPMKLVHDEDCRKKKGKCIEGEADSGLETSNRNSNENTLATLDIFAGCGGLSEGLHQSGVTTTKWAIEYEQAAGDAFKLNHPESLVFVNNCNVILRAIMQKCGDVDDCISTSEANDLAASLSEKDLDSLPLPGQVDFINGGPPCQGFSGMNRFNHSTWSKVQCEMILAFLSFAEYYRPKYFLLENVRNFVSFNQGQTFRLTLASLLEMGYQVRFGILEAGSYGVPQSRKRAFIWAASPDEVLPDWPEPMHVFAAPQLKITLSANSHYAAAKSTANGAPFRPLTVRDTIGDLPAVTNGASNTNLEYKGDPESWFQKKIRGNSMVLSDHISKEMNELNLVRCERIPRRPGCDWRDLPDEKVKLSSGQMADLIPWCLPNTAKRHNQWKGLFGRLDWEGNFPTSVTDPQPMGKVGMCFHPEQDRIVTVRECARSQGFPDTYKFAGNILHKHRQIGNAVPPPLAYALGRKLKEAFFSKNDAS